MCVCVCDVLILSNNQTRLGGGGWEGESIVL